MNRSSGCPASRSVIEIGGLDRAGEIMGDSWLRGVVDSSSRGVDQVVLRPRGFRGLLDTLSRPCRQTVSQNDYFQLEGHTFGGGTDSDGDPVLVNPDKLANRSEILSRSARTSSDPPLDIMDVTLRMLLTSEGFLRIRAAMSLMEDVCTSSCSVSASLSDSLEPRSESSSTSRMEAGRLVTSVISLPALHVCDRGRSRCA